MDGLFFILFFEFNFIDCKKFNFMLIIKIYEIVYIPPKVEDGLQHRTTYKYMNDTYYARWKKTKFFKKNVIACKVFKKLSIKLKIEDLKL